MAVYRHNGAMRTRIPIESEQIVAALNESNGDMKAAARLLEISDRTLYRRMADFGIRAKVEFQAEKVQAA